MKRSLITFAAVYLLYDRQRRVERRLLERQQAYELGIQRFATEITEELNTFADDYRDWAEQLVKRIERAFKEGAR